MNDEDRGFESTVAIKAARKLRVQRDDGHAIWSGLGVSGLIGWSVAVPTLLGAMAGLWWDRHHPGGRSLTLMLLVAGLVFGCANAWLWMARQDKAMHMNDEDRERDGD
jgi:ATP synthase protein I